MVQVKIPANAAGLNVPPAYLATAQAELSADQRMLLARKEGARRPGKDAGEAEILLRRYILGIIIADAEVRVRQALAETLAENPDAPRDVILALAKDADVVATPVLKLSDILTAEDMIAIIGDQASLVKMAAMADRRHVLPDVCLALIERGDADTADRLLRNPGADISEAGLHRIVDRHGELHDLQSSLVARAALPATVIERAIAVVSFDLVARLVERHAISSAAASKLALATRERATLGLTSGLPAECMRTLAEQLIAEGRLTTSLLLRSLCLGNLDLAIHVIAIRSRLSIDYARGRLMEGDNTELKQLWLGAELPAKLLPAAKLAIAIMKETSIEGMKWDAAFFRSRIVQRIITGVAALSSEFGDDDIKELLAVAAGGDV